MKRAIQLRFSQLSVSIGICKVQNKNENAQETLPVTVSGELKVEDEFTDSGIKAENYI